MPAGFDIFSSIMPSAGVDSDYLSGVQKGFEGSGVGLSAADLVGLFFAFLTIILLVILLYRVFKPKIHRLTKQELNEITNKNEIEKIINRSIDLRAVYDIEVLDQEYREIYKGQALKVNEYGEIEVEVGSYIDPYLDFEDQSARVAFRMSRRGNEEFYQFETYTLYIGLTTVNGRKEKAVRLAMPSVIRIGQKRKYIRMVPSGKHRFTISLADAVKVGDAVPLQGFRRLHRTEVSNISVGGFEAVLQARTGEIKVRPGDEVYAIFKLPTYNLDVIEEIPEEYMVRVRIVTVLRQTTGRRALSRESDEQTIGPHFIRAEFIGRAKVDKKKRLAFFSPITPYLFEDLSRWIQAYQRFQIQEEKDTGRRPEELKNQFPRQNHDIKPKYPSYSPKRKMGESVEKKDAE